MEGADSTPEGAPSAYTVRRYVNEAIGGSAVIWFEAISIVEEGRSSQTQLLLTRDTLDEFKKMTAAVKEAGIKANGYAPYLIMQANHSGRYSNPGNKPAPMIAYRHPILEQYRAADDSCIVSDDYLKGLEVKFGEAAALAKEAGFDAVDIKSCHGYLLAELASATTAPARTAAALKTASACSKTASAPPRCTRTTTLWSPPALASTTLRLPVGLRRKPESGTTPDLTEPKRLVRELHDELGVDMSI